MENKYKDATFLTNEFLRIRAEVLALGIPYTTATLLAISKLVFPFSGKKKLTMREQSIIFLAIMATLQGMDQGAYN
jgi:hypothetical protein